MARKLILNGGTIRLTGLLFDTRVTLVDMACGTMNLRHMYWAVSGYQQEMNCDTIPIIIQCE